MFLDNKNDVQLDDYKIVIWFTGDNTNHVTTIQPKEMAPIASFLSNGGSFFISGSKIGYDLDERMSAFTDTLFYYNYLKAEFKGIGDATIPPASGIAGTVFSGVDLNYGEVFEEKYPDDIDAKNGSELLFNYNFMRNDSTFRHAGVGYKGIFGSGTVAGQMVYITFPLESVASLQERKSFFKSLLQYFGIISEVKSGPKTQPLEFSLSQNYPNPFNPTTRIRYTLPANYNSIVRLEVYDILGHKVSTLVNKKQKAGNYEIEFSANSGNHHLASGVYFAQLRTGNFSKTISLLLLK